MINVAVLGYGTVGSGVVEVIEKNKDMVNKKSAQELKVKLSSRNRHFSPFRTLKEQSLIFR